MAEKQLTESAWKTFSKGKTYKDAAFVKALAEFAKAEKDEKGGSKVQLEALDEIEKQGGALVKANKGDKELAGYIEDVEKALAKQRKEAQALAKKEQEAAEGDDEEDAPDLLTTKMIPLVRMVKKGETVHTMVASNGKETAVLLMRRSISPSRRKLLTEYLGVSSCKFFKGEVGPGEGNVMLFSLETTGGAGLAKRIRQAIFDQTNMRVKVKLRAADTGEEEDDGGAAVDDEGNVIESKEPNAMQVRYEQRSAALEERITKVLKANVPEAAKIRAVQNFASEKAEADEYAAALKSLDMLETLVGAAEKAAGGKTEAPTTTRTEQPAPTPQEGGKVDPARAFNARLAALLPKVKEAVAVGHAQAGDARLKVAQAGEAATKEKDYEKAGSLLDEVEELLLQVSKGGGGEQGYKGIVAYRASLVEFRKAANTVNARIAQLRVAIPAELDDERDLADELADVLTEMTEQMLDTVDAAMKAGENEASPITAELRDRIVGYHDEVMKSELVSHVDANPFKVNTAVRETLGGALAAVRKALPTPA